MKQCLFCHKETDNSECPNCNKGIFIDKRKIYYANMVFTFNQWMSYVCSFAIDKNNNIFLKRQINGLDKRYLMNIFDKNIKKYTFLGLILPCIMFLGISLITSGLIAFFCYKGNFKDEDIYKSFIFLLFICLIIFALGCYLLVRILKKDKCFLTKEGKYYRQRYISNNEYNKIHEFIERMD